MKFSLYKNAKSRAGELCTYERYLEVTSDPKLLELCKEIAAIEDSEERSELKKKLPVVTWQAYFEGRRVAKEAQPSGLFMLDIDHVDDPWKLYNEKIASQIKHLGIVYVGKTASTHGIRIVAKCQPHLRTIADCQNWLASNLKVEHDGVCKDWARCSFLVHDSYTYYMSAGEIWQAEAEPGCIYNVDDIQRIETAGKAACEPRSIDYKDMTEKSDDTSEEIDQREGLFGGMDEYHGLKLTDIARRWLVVTGGEPEKGERNARLYKLATRMRYLTDFNTALLVRIMPTYGLGAEEMRQLCASAINATRSQDMPKDLSNVISKMEKLQEMGLDADEDDFIDDGVKMPKLPPIFKEFHEVAPTDFQEAVVLCQLPILGALGSKLRAKYLDGNMHSPSFQVSLEAPQASGKSFMRKLVEYELGQMIEHDEMQREKEREYDAKIKEMRMLNIKVTVDNKDEVLGTRPKTLVRFVPATMSITKLLQRMDAAQGLHLFALSEEIDTVTKAFKRGFSSYSDLLRVSFDNGLYGQDYASENSFSGNVRLYYNFLTSGTPKAMRRFYPDVEDGLVSRVCFVTLPDQFGKQMPVWREFDHKQKAIVDTNLVRLNEISIIGDDVQPDHVMKMEFVNRAMQKWILEQQGEALKNNDRTRDIFCRRAAVVGFRAAMLAYFLWGESKSPTIRKYVIQFAKWVATCMLNQHVLRFKIDGSDSNINRWEDLFVLLPDTFDRNDVQKLLDKSGVDSPVRKVVSAWKMAGVVEVVEWDHTNSQRGKKAAVKFRKIKK